MEKRQIVITLPDGSEIFKEIRPFGANRHDPCDWYELMRRTAENVVQDSGMTTDRHNPQPIRVLITTLAIKDDKFVRTDGFFRDIIPPLSPMTESDYRLEMDKTLSTLPEEFRKFVESQVWERASSNEEAVSFAQELTDTLSKPIKEFSTRLLK